MTALKREKLSEHEMSVSYFYSKNIDSYLELSDRPYRNWGYWTNGADNIQEASQMLSLKVAEQLNINSQETVLDVGCAFGSSTLDIYAKTSCKSIYGIDIVAEHIDYAQKAASELGVEKGVKFKQMSATDMKFGDEFFDKIFVIDAASHFNTREDFFHQSYRILKSGGQMVLLDLIQTNTPKNPLQKLLTAMMLKFWKVPLENKCTKQEYKKLLHDAGFREITLKLYSEHIFPGAFRAYLSQEMLSDVYSKFGPVRAFIWKSVVKTMQKMYKNGTLDFYMISVKR